MSCAKLYSSSGDRGVSNSQYVPGRHQFLATAQYICERWGEVSMHRTANQRFIIKNMPASNVLLWNILHAKELDNSSMVISSLIEPTLYHWILLNTGNRLRLNNNLMLHLQNTLCLLLYKIEHERFLSKEGVKYFRRVFVGRRGYIINNYFMVSGHAKMRPSVCLYVCLRD